LISRSILANCEVSAKLLKVDEDLFIPGLWLVLTFNALLWYY